MVHVVVDVVVAKAAHAKALTLFYLIVLSSVPLLACALLLVIVSFASFVFPRPHIAVDYNHRATLFSPWGGVQVSTISGQIEER